MDSNALSVEKFSISKAIESGWDGFKSNLLILIGLFLLAWLIILAPHMLLRLFEGMFGSGSFMVLLLTPIISLLSFALSLLVVMGLLKISLKVCDKQSPAPEDLFACYPLLLNYFLATLVVGLIITVGLFLFIVPGIIWAIQFSQYRYLIVDKNIGPLESLRQSSTLTKGARWNLFGFFMLMIGINVVGAMFLAIGLLATIPITFISTAAVYKQLLNSSTAVTAA